MLGKRTRPVMIGKLSELLVSGGRAAAISEAIGSPRSPLDLMKMQSPSSSSPKGLKSYDHGGVGLAIVVALDNEIFPKHAVSVCNCTATTPNSMNRDRSRPIPVHNTKQNQQQHGLLLFHDHDDTNDVPNSSSEDYTYVTYRIPNNKTITKVYYDGGEEGRNLRHDYRINNNVGVVRTTTQNLVVDEGDEASFSKSDFLSSCYLCRKKLHGKDIYMYRGEKGFCSPECRSRQIMIEERKEVCRSEASRSVEVSSSPYKRDQMFSTGIIAL
ncbi:hypothetical protein PIB30_055405 [Stylosanthes scabra]|uniref:FLZ-type domain-containing protein n=1 Tax=Stylosanthes scabra TaxID=79078 RepID=A0ABU6WHB4_9FABA|nr:hypothetical protein [Stylosanthes scabra]